ncbi:putative ATP-dependent endonuclease of OLD family [Lentzea flaviverrucosa]|uniref:Putative ATP-dependent endonuclease of the OLD family n=1 Tax=Lentzea flaviverrucosa TaxID=200379 RepID=A0A1H9F9V3_9PSEU|nr:putative ATP-dependent endonuclease of OLD family [Lentzea flaviverrucosa]SEQ34687.1 putative ATP-dependent endonuclease of the OLD family [Lentzea flaviverrucosa]
MKVRRVSLHNFRGVQHGTVMLEGHSLLVGRNSVGKSTICEALDLVLGPERLFRRPVIDEYDFYAARYQEVDAVLPEVRVEVVLTELSPEARRRFNGRVRRWSTTTADFVDTTPGALEVADEEGIEWCLPVVFLGRFDPAEDDFVGGTFFAHPQVVTDDLTDEPAQLGGGLKPFTREDKWLCGFLYLRANRTGSRALSFQRGSLIDTIVRLESRTEGSLWEKALRDVGAVTIADDDSGFAKIRTEVRRRVGRFLTLTDDPDAVDLQVSELTREHLREVLRLFVATQPGAHGVPFTRLSTGSLNLLVFALLTYIAELKGDDTVIFAMEEPEIALPPHAQRRLVDFVLKRMGQAIVTSHSPYVIEKFTPEQLVVLSRNTDGALTSTNVVLPADFKRKKYGDNRRQFAEAVLARAVLVVEGATEAAAFPLIADVLDQDATLDYQHIDLAGVSLFDAGGDAAVPLFAPVFAAMGKPVYGIHDTPTSPLSADATAKATDFTLYEVIPHAGVEKLLVQEVPVEVLRRFAAQIPARADFDPAWGALDPAATDDDVRKYVFTALKGRKGTEGYVPLLLAQCSGVAELPASMAGFLQRIDTDLRDDPPPADPGAQPDAP